MLGRRDTDGAQLVDLPRALIADGDTPAAVRFLSTFDAVLLLGHATRARLVPDEHRAKVFSSKLPQSLPTFLVDGRVSVPSPSAPLPASVRDEAESAALARAGDRV